MKLSRRFVINSLYLIVAIPIVVWAYWRYYVNDMVNAAATNLQQSKYQEAFDNANKAIDYGCREARCYFIRGYSRLALIELGKDSNLAASKADLNQALELAGEGELREQCKQFLEMIAARQKEAAES